MRERADNGSLRVCPEFRADGGRRAGWTHVGRVDRMVQYRDPLVGNSLRDEVQLDGGGASNQMALASVPDGRRETVNMSDRRRTAKQFEPTAPPTGARQVRMQ